MSDYYNLMKPFGPRIGHFILNDNDFEKIKTPALEVLNDPKRQNYGKNLAGMIADEPAFFLNQYPEVSNILTERVKHYLHTLLQDWQITYGTLEINVHECWLVNQKSNEYNPAHTHGGSNISGVMYIQVPKQMTFKQDLKFKFENAGRMPLDGFIEFINASHRETTEFECGGCSIPPTEGHLFIFPSRLTHTVYPFINEQDESRISLSFNSKVQIKAPGASMMQMLGA